MNQTRHFTLFLFLVFFFSTPVQAAQNIGALGKIFPQGGIISLTGTPGDIINQVHADAGDRVEKGELLVDFASKKRLEQEVILARSSMDRLTFEANMTIQIQEKKLETIRIKSNSVIALQRAKLNTAKENLEYTQGSLDRLLSAGKGSFSAQRKEDREHQNVLSKIRQETAMAELKRLKNDRNADLALGQMELSRLTISRDHKLAQAREQLETAQKNLENSDLKSPVSGTILDIMLKKGETAGSVPIVRLADLSVMTVIADVFQADLLKITKGMKASITSKSLPKAITGKVASIGRVIKDPSKVAKVVIVLDDPKLASRLINLEVEVSILTKK